MKEKLEQMFNKLREFSIYRESNKISYTLSEDSYNHIIIDIVDSDILDSDRSPYSQVVKRFTIVYKQKTYYVTINIKFSLDEIKDIDVINSMVEAFVYRLRRFED